MRMVLGVREVAGEGNNPMIMRWAEEIGAPDWYDNDDKPWCTVPANRSLMAVHLPMARHLDPRKRDGFDLLRAETFVHYGLPLEETTLGCILVFKRPGGHHVAFYLGENDTHYCVIGGNQSNDVSIMWIKKERCIAKRWPTDIPIPVSGPVRLTRTGVISNDEA